jgi:hypothetical protein
VKRPQAWGLRILILAYSSCVAGAILAAESVAYVSKEGAPMSHRFLVCFLPALSLAMGAVLLIEVVSLSQAGDTPRDYTRTGALCAAAPVVVGAVALLMVMRRTRVDWEVNRGLMLAGALLVAFGLAISAASYAEFTDPQAFARGAPESLRSRAAGAGVGAFASWALIPAGFLLHVLAVIPMKYKAKYDREEAPFITDILKRDRTPPR